MVINSAVIRKGGGRDSIHISMKKVPAAAGETNKYSHLLIQSLGVCSCPALLLRHPLSPPPSLSSIRLLHPPFFSPPPSSFFSSSFFSFLLIPPPLSSPPSPLSTPPSSFFFSSHLLFLLLLLLLLHPPSSSLLLAASHRVICLLGLEAVMEEVRSAETRGNGRAVQ